MVEDNIIQDFVNTIKSDQQENTKTYLATVSRVENDGSVFVRIAGSDIETPTAMTSAEISRGDVVNVEWRNNKLYIAGNASDPSVSTSRANGIEKLANSAFEDASRARTAADSAEASATEAKATADSVHGIAVQAQEDAEEASTAAATASTQAQAASTAAAAASTQAQAAATAASNAQTAADTALVNLATTEDVVGVLNWITAHGTMTTQSGGVFVPGQVYFVLDDATPGDYHVGNHYYSVVPEPKAADIDSYYILTVDESVQNYVATHIVVDAEGLWIIPDAGGNKVLIATGSGSTYTTAGTYIVGKVGGVDAVFAKFTADGATMQRGSTDIAHLGYGPGTNSGGGTANAPYYTIGTRFSGSTIGNYSIAEGRSATASGYCSHAEGYASKSTGHYSHAEGMSSEAKALYSHAQNRGTKAGKVAQTTLGTFNVEDTAAATTHPASVIYDNPPDYGQYAVIIGNGTGDEDEHAVPAYSNALTVDWSGNVMAQGMAGMIQMFAGSTAPTGWLMCDGTTYNVADYPQLAAVVGATYGGNGTTTFAVPDMRGRMPLGSSSSHSLASTGGSEYIQAHTHSNTIKAKTPKFTHTISSSNSNVNLLGGGSEQSYGKGGGSGSTYPYKRLSVADHAATDCTMSGSVGAVSGATTGNEGNMPPFLTINYIIATGKTA